MTVRGKVKNGRVLLENPKALAEGTEVEVRAVRKRRGAAKAHTPKTKGPTRSVCPSIQLPAWCNVYEGLDDEQIARLEDVILQRANLTRASE